MRKRLTFSSGVLRHCPESYNPNIWPEPCGPAPAPIATRANGLDCHGDSQPATQAGGDFFDLIPRDTGLAISIGSVAGTDEPAAILKAGIQACVRALAAARTASCGTLVEDLNRIVCAVSLNNLYATLFFAQIDAPHRRLTYVNAGHEPALLVRPHSGRVRLLESSGAVLGLTARSRYQQRTIPLQLGDVLVAFTDGVSDTLSSRDGELGHALILRMLQELPGATAADLVARLLAASTATSESARPDRTAIAVRFIPTQGEELRVVHAAESLVTAPPAVPLQAACGAR